MTSFLPRSRKSTWFLLPVIGLALFVRLRAWPYQEIVSIDGTNYIRLARFLFGGLHHDSQQPPGYPFLIGLAGLLIGGDGVRAARIVDLVCGLALLVPFFLLARRLFGHLAAFALAVMLALTPLMIRYSVTTMSECPYVLMALLAALALHSGRNVLTGVAGGLAFLVRPEGMILTGVLALVRVRKPRALLSIAAAFLAAGVLPALMFNHQTTGEWMLTRKGVNLTGDNFWENEVSAASTVGGPRRRPFVERLTANVDAVKRTYPDRFGAEILNLGRSAGWPFTVLILPGLPVGPAAVVAGLAQALVVPLFPAVPSAPRFVVPLIPFVLLLGAGIVHRLVRGRAHRDERAGPDRSGRRRVTATAGWALAACLLAGWLIPTVKTWRTVTWPEDGFYPELVEAGRWLSKIARPEDLVFDRKPYTAFYAGARYQTTPLAGYHETLDAIIKAGGDYLVVDETVATIFRPALLPLIHDAATMLNEPRLVPIYFNPTLRDRHVAVYRVLRPGSATPPDRGREELRRYIGRLPHDPTLHTLHGEIAELAGRPDEAIREYEMALERAPGDPDARTRLSGLLARQGTAEH